MWSDVLTPQRSDQLTVPKRLMSQFYRWNPGNTGKKCHGRDESAQRAGTDQYADFDLWRRFGGVLMKHQRSEVTVSIDPLRSMLMINAPPPRNPDKKKWTAVGAGRQTQKLGTGFKIFRVFWLSILKRKQHLGVMSSAPTAANMCVKRKLQT